MVDKYQCLGLTYFFFFRDITFTSSLIFFIIVRHSRLFCWKVCIVEALLYFIS